MILSKSKGLIKKISQKKRGVRGASKKTARPSSIPISDDLLENPDLLLQIIDCIPNGFALYDPDDRLIAYNDEYLNFSGLGKRDLGGKPAYKTLLEKLVKKHPAIFAGLTAKQWIRKRLKTHKPPCKPFETRVHDGRWIKIQNRWTKSGYTVSTFNDISDLKERESSLLESSQMAEMAQNRLISAIESISEAFVLFDAEDRFVMCNSLYRKQIGDVSKLLRPGIPYLDLTKAVADNRYKNRPTKERDAWIKLRLQHHKYPGTILETQYPNGRWARYQDFKTNDGSRVSLFADITEAKEHELALRKSEQLFQQAIESMTEDFAMFDAKDRLVTYNSNFYENHKTIKGIRSPDITLGDMVHSFAKRGQYGKLSGGINKFVQKRLIQLKSPGVTETQYTDGNWWQLKINKTNDGGFVLVRSNITKQKNAATLLQSREEALRLVLETVLDAIITIDEKGRIASFNPAAEKIFGYKAKEVIGKNVKILMPPPYKGKHDGYLKRYVTTNDPQMIGTIGRQATGRRKNGTEFPVELAISEHVQDGKRVFTGILRDITKRKFAEDALRESEERYALTIKGINEGIWDWNLKTNHLFVSDRVEQIVGIGLTKKIKSTNNIVNNDFIFSEIHPDDVAIYRQALASHLKGDAPSFYCEFRVTRKDKKQRWVRNRGRALFDDSGRAYRMTGSVTDVTIRKTAEQKMFEAKEIAEIASRTKTEFLANVSHELRTPLNAIIGFSDLMKTEIFGPMGHAKYSDYSHAINESGQHLLSIINDILDVSQVEVGELDFDLEKVLLEPVFESCIRLIHERAEKAGLRLKTKINAGLPALKADPRRLKQILLNLLSNAIKFTPKGGMVSLKAYQTKAGTMVLSVSDTGIGMKAADIPKVMTPFVQVDSKLSRQYEGTGLGLPLTRELVHLHGATIKIRSKPRKGTTVSVYFPKETVLT